MCCGFIRPAHGGRRDSACADRGISSDHRAGRRRAARSHLRVGLNADGSKIAKEDAGAGRRLRHQARSPKKTSATGWEQPRGWKPHWRCALRAGNRYGALGSAGAIENFPPLAGVEALTIFADNDEDSGRGTTGRAGLRRAMERCRFSQVFIRTPRGVRCRLGGLCHESQHQPRNAF